MGNTLVSFDTLLPHSRMNGVRPSGVREEGELRSSWGSGEDCPVGVAAHDSEGDKEVLVVISSYGPYLS